MKRARQAVAPAIALLALALAAVRCSFYDESMLLPAPSGAVTDAGVEAAVAPDADAAIDPCAHALPPPRPPGEDHGPNLPSVVMAIRTLTYSDSPDGGVRLGYDVDGTCTCAFEQPPSCAPRSGGKIACDDGEGRDNALGVLLQRLGNLSPAFRELSISNELEQGDRGLVLEVRNWSGAADDPSVVVALYASNGVGTTDAGRLRPRWDGTDRFTLTPESLLGGKLIGEEPPPVYFDDHAYVAGGVLVGRPVSEAPFSGIFGIPIQISSVVVTGRLVPTGGAWGLSDGQLVGRTSTGSLLTGLSAVPDPTDNSQFLCGSSGVYRTLRTLMCQSADVLIAPEGKDRAATCDGLTAAFAVTAFPARFGAVEPIRRPATGCDAGYSDDCDP